MFVCSTILLTFAIATAIKSGAIPIVYSKTVDGIKYPDYDRFFPKDSNHPASDGYINLADFNSSREAAEFIKAVGLSRQLVCFSISYMLYGDLFF